VYTPGRIRSTVVDRDRQNLILSGFEVSDDWVVCCVGYRVDVHDSCTRVGILVARVILGTRRAAILAFTGNASLRSVTEKPIGAGRGKKRVEIHSGRCGPVFRNAGPEVIEKPLARLLVRLKPRGTPGKDDRPTNEQNS
jgi:hypothetical protein